MTDADPRQHAMPTISPARRLFFGMRREKPHVHKAVVTLRHAGNHVWRSSTRGLHTVNGRKYNDAQVLELAARCEKELENAGYAAGTAR